MDEKWKGSLDQWKTREDPEDPYPVKCGLCGEVYPADCDLDDELHHHAKGCRRRQEIERLLDL